MIEIPATVFWPAILAAASYIIVEIIKLKVSMAKKVTYDQCHINRKECHCVKQIEKIKKVIKNTTSKGKK